MEFRETRFIRGEIKKLNGTKNINEILKSYQYKRLQHFVSKSDRKFLRFLQV